MTHFQFYFCVWRWSCPWNSDQNCTQIYAWQGLIGVKGVVGDQWWGLWNFRGQQMENLGSVEVLWVGIGMEDWESKSQRLTISANFRLIIYENSPKYISLCPNVKVWTPQGAKIYLNICCARDRRNVSSYMSK